MLKVVDIVIMLAGVVLLLTIKRNAKNTSSFDISEMNSIKGFSSIMIVLFHLSQHINGGFLFKVIGDTGYLSVAVFFFISGYGMYTRVLQTGGVTAKALFLTEYQVCWFLG
ncbi:MAG: hypothetical protein ILA24_03860 [Ruminococcus sp.]|nr:hypothetical protein [Ruminococcus sp.]